MTRYALVSWGEREANNELKAGLLGRDRHVLSITAALLLHHRRRILCFLGVMSASEMQDLKSEQIFPWLQNCPESEK